MAMSMQCIAQQASEAPPSGIIPNASSQTLFPIIREKTKLHSIVYTDSFRAYYVLDVSKLHHYRINHSELLADQRNHINGIESIWNQSKRHLRHYNGIPKQWHPERALPSIPQ
jgi:transposase